MAIDIFNLIKKYKFFFSLSDDAIRSLITKFDKLYLRQNDILFKQGDVSRELYFVVSGKIILILKTENKEEKIVDEREAGETVGELSTLSQQPHSVTAKALENSIVLVLPREVYYDLLKKYPAIASEIIALLVNRSRNYLQLLSDKDHERKNVVLVPANKNAYLNDFYDALIREARNIPGVAVLNDYDADFRNAYSSQLELNKYIDTIKSKNNVVIYLLASVTTPLAKNCFENPDIIYIVANGGSRPYISHLVLNKINQSHSGYLAKSELILAYDESASAPKKTSKWLKLSDFAMHHHVRIYRETDLQRMLRFMRRKAVGLVLGGGGLRCWAHVGAIKALKEAGIPIDIVGGTSAGAIVAGHYALHETDLDPHHHLQKLAEVTRHTVSLRDLTWPVISLFDGKAYTETQKEMFSDARIENLWLPSFYVSCNLSENKLVVNRKGYLWKAVRSSTAVPAIFPPVVIRGEIHLDGGILNNLPVDVMRKMIGRSGTAIAVELTHYTKDENFYNFPPVLTFTQTVLAKLHLAYKEYKFPHFVDTFLKSLLAGSAAKQQENSLAADILIKPDLASFGLLSVTKKQEKILTELGYNAAIEAIKLCQKKDIT